MTDREKFEAWLTGGASELHNMLLIDKYDNGAYRLAKSENQWQAWQAAIASQQPADDDWVEWVGGERPVADNERVQVKFADGYTGLIDRPQDIRWHTLGSVGDIIAYRVVKP